MRTITRLKEDFALDQITLGDGQCFMTSCIQQLRRPTINCALPPRWQQILKIMDPRALKSQVRKFMQTCQHQRVQELRMNWRNFTGMSFEDYWSIKYIMKKSTTPPSMKAIFALSDIISENVWELCTNGAQVV